MRVLVTGGLGFLGHAVVRQLFDDGHQVTALTSRPDAKSRIDGVDLAHADIRDRTGLTSIVREVQPEGVCHLAALTRVRDSFDDPLSFFDVNVGGTVALLGALADAGLPPVKLVFSSTGAVYGPAEGRISEDHPTNPTNPYGASKLAAEQLISHHAATGAIGAVILRAFNIAGAVDGVGDSDTTRIVPAALAVAAGKLDKVIINGDGSAIREFTHVADIIAAVALVLDSANPDQIRTYNVGSGVEATVRDIIDLTSGITGALLTVENRSNRNELAMVIADSSELRRNFNWSPQFGTINSIVSAGWEAIV